MESDFNIGIPARTVQLPSSYVHEESPTGIFSSLIFLVRYTIVQGRRLRHIDDTENITPPHIERGVAQNEVV